MGRIAEYGWILEGKHHSSNTLSPIQSDLQPVQRTLDRLNWVWATESPLFLVDFHLVLQKHTPKKYVMPGSFVRGVCKARKIFQLYLSCPSEENRRIYTLNWLTHYLDQDWDDVSCDT